MSDDPMDLCLLLEEPAVPAWQARALKNLLSAEDVTVRHIIYDGTDDSRSPRETLRRALDLREWAVVGPLNEFLFAPPTETVPIDSFLDRTAVTERTVVPTAVDGWKKRLPAEPVEAAAAESDVAIRLAFGFIVGPVLEAFEHGVLSYHHGDLREYRGQPMGFWEFLHGVETAGVTVQQLTDDLDAGRIAALRTVDIGDAPTWEAVKRRLFAASEPMLTEAVRALREGTLRDPETLGTIRSHPKGAAVARFAVKNATGHLRTLLDGDRLRGSETRAGPPRPDDGA